MESPTDDVQFNKALDDIQRRYSKKSVRGDFDLLSSADKKKFNFNLVPVEGKMVYVEENGNQNQGVAEWNMISPDKKKPSKMDDLLDSQFMRLNSFASGRLDQNKFEAD